MDRVGRPVVANVCKSFAKSCSCQHLNLDVSRPTSVLSCIKICPNHFRLLVIICFAINLISNAQILVVQLLINPHGVHVSPYLGEIDVLGEAASVDDHGVFDGVKVFLQGTEGHLVLCQQQQVTVLTEQKIKI